MARQKRDPGQSVVIPAQTGDDGPPPFAEPEPMAQTSITYQLASISEDAIAAADRMFMKRFGLHVHEIRVLRLIGDQPGVTFTVLARQTKFERSATSRILSRLIRNGFVRRVNDKVDARQFRLFVSAKGARLREQADPLTHDIESLMLSILDEEQQAQFASALSRLSGWINAEFTALLAERYPEVAGPPGRAARRKQASSPS